MSNPESLPEPLLHHLRDVASQAAELAGGGLCLVYAGMPEPDGSRAQNVGLRAASGFSSPEMGRAVATELAAGVERCFRTGASARAEAPQSAAASGAGGALLLPLSWSDTTHGVLAIASPEEIDGALVQKLQPLAAGAGVQLDHLAQSRELAHLRNRPVAAEASEEQDPDELLKLSEALFAQDIQLLRNNEKLGKIEKLKNDFIEKMSRELRTPLNNIIEAIISVIAGENDRLSDASVASLRSALDEGTSFQRTLQNILDLWRIKQNELPVETQEVNFAEVVEEAIFSVQDTLGDKPVVIHKNFAETLPKIRTDLAKVNQLLFLLLDNAAKFTEKGQIVIAPRLEGDHLVCDVQDTGIGICPDDQELVFDEFFQVDSMSSTRYRGAGLGMSLARDLLVLLGGDIALQSEAGKGTTLTFSIPVEPV